MTYSFFMKDEDSVLMLFPSPPNTDITIFNELLCNRKLCKHCSVRASIQCTRGMFAFLYTHFPLVKLLRFHSQKVHTVICNCFRVLGCSIHLSLHPTPTSTPQSCSSIKKVLPPAVLTLCEYRPIFQDCCKGVVPDSSYSSLGWIRNLCLESMPSSFLPKNIPFA